MGFLLAVLGAMGALGFWIWRARSAAEGARAATELAGDAASALRRFGFRRKAGANPLDAEEDPRLAAMAAMASMARMDGERSMAQTAVLTAAAKDLFLVSEEEARDMAAYGFWLSAQAEPEEALRRLDRNLSRSLGPKEWAELISAMRAAAVAEGPLSERQTEALARAEQARRTASRSAFPAS